MFCAADLQAQSVLSGFINRHIDFEFRALRQKTERILVDESVDCVLGMAPLFHFERGFWNGERVAVAPVAGAIQPELFVPAVSTMSIARAGVHFDSG